MTISEITLKQKWVGGYHPFSTFKIKLINNETGRVVHRALSQMELMTYLSTIKIYPDISNWQMEIDLTV